MKRSEMVENIKYMLTNPVLLDSGTLANDILNMIEEAGMLPPDTGYDTTDTCNVWEYENETK